MSYTKLVAFSERIVAEQSRGQFDSAGAATLVVDAIVSLCGDDGGDDGGRIERTIAHISERFDALKDSAPYALEFAALVVNIARRFDLPKWIGRANHDYGKLLASRGRAREAELAFRDAIDAWGDDFPDFVDVAQGDLGAALRARNELAEAEPLLRRALAAAKRTDSVHNQVEWALQLGQTLGAAGQHVEALAILREGQALARQASKPYHESALLTALANVFENEARYDLSLQYHHLALAISQHRQDAASEAVDHQNIGNLHCHFHRHLDAESSYRQALSLSTTADSKATQAASLSALGSLYVTMGRLDAAEDALTTAARLADTHGLSYELQRALSHLANVRFLRGDPEAARALHAQSLTLARATGDRRSAVIDLCNLSVISRELGDVADAYARAGDAVVLAMELGDPPLIHAAARHAAVSMIGLPATNPDDVWSLFERSMTALEAPRQHVAADTDRVDLYGGGKHVVYEEAVSWLLNQQRVNRAFEVAERAKSRLLLDGLAERREGRLSAPESYSQLMSRLEPHSNTAYVSLFLTDTETLVFVVSPGTTAISCTRLAVSKADWDAWSAQWSSVVDRLAVDAEHPARSAAQVRETLETLNRMLAGELRRLTAEAGIEYLMIGAHQSLHGVPLHAATDPETGRALVEDVAICYVPALQLVRNSSSNTTRRAMLVLSDPLTDLVALPEARSEADGISALFDATHLAGGAATTDAFLARAPQASAIHLACHGVFDGQRPDASYLRLTDRPLFARDISALRCPSLDLVVTAACESGRSRTGGVDEALGMTRAWLLAGAAAVVSAGWAVDDMATHHFMRAFYESLHGGASLVHAFREGQRALQTGDMIERDPRSWGAFRFISTELS